MKINERVWAGYLVSWIQEEIRDNKSIFQDATIDMGIKVESGRTKFPDILVFTDKISGIIFNGWELKFPDTKIDDRDLLLNALEKAKRIKSDSFVVWNGAEAVIWGIKNEIYTIDYIYKVKTYPKELNINSREDLSEPNNYKKYEKHLRERLSEILYDLQQLYLNGNLKSAINVFDNFIQAVKDASDLILPQFQNEISRLKGINPEFREDFNNWKVYESYTLKVLASSSQKKENVVEEEVLAKFAFYNLIGKILFYLTLSENLIGSLERIDLNGKNDIKTILGKYFNQAQRIDYQAVFKPYFTDQLTFNDIINESLIKFLSTVSDFDFKILPTGVIGTILENLVPKDEKHKFGQYFTETTLANLVAFPVVKTQNDILFDPTSGTGTFLNSFYHILNYFGNENHTQLLNQIWGNDISHFPAILSVINLYKQKLNEVDNFPRVIRDDYFNLEPNKKITFPDSRNYVNQIEQPIPIFDGIASNFPFIQQEDFSGQNLSAILNVRLGQEQTAFYKNDIFKINERSDYYAYCVYNSLDFLKEGGYLSIITPNAWLGKEYGLQFKQFILDNFHIKYVIRSNNEHWFSDSKISTIFFVLRKQKNTEPTKFVSINFKLTEKFDQENLNNQIKEIENFYIDIDNCTNPKAIDWIKDKTFGNLYHKKDNSVSVSIVANAQLKDSILKQNNWDTYFISANILEKLDAQLIELYPKIIDSFRGARTGWNEMFIVSKNNIEKCKIENEFLIPYIKSPTEFDKIEFSGEYEYFLFVCDLPIEVLEKDYQGAFNWISKFQNAKNRNGMKTIQEACSGHKPYWYSLNAKKANIVTAINPYERFFFSYSENPFTIDQRLVGITVKDSYDVELIAALLNSIINFISIEMIGTSRNLGALDLNANYFKTLRVLNPNKLTVAEQEEIKKAFQPLKKRSISTIFEELKMDDRINFDNIVLKLFGIDESIRATLYEILLTEVDNRVNMKHK